MSSAVCLIVLLLTFLSHFSATLAYGGRPPVVGGERWAVIVAGAHGYNNYFSQANACHAYQILRQGGIPAENIIHFNYDDVANDKANPVKNNLINTLNGTNVYDGCVIDYRGKDVTPKVFIDVLTGNQTGVEILTGRKGKVLKSGPGAEVFLYMTDHGGESTFDFPNAMYLTPDSLANALNFMYQQELYGLMVIFMDSCYSGSMFQGLLPKNRSIYAVTSTNPHELGWLNCWDNHRGVYLSSMFSYTWMYTTEQLGTDTKSLHQLYQKTYQACSNFSGKSHPQEYGTDALGTYFLDHWMGDHAGTNKSHVCRTNPVMDQNILKELDKEFTFPFEEDVLSPLFLESPPVDMVSVATVIRRLLSQTLTQGDRESLKAELNYLLKIKILAQEMIKSVKEYVSKSVEDSPTKSSTRYLDRNEILDCYIHAMERVKSQCPLLQPQRFPFINRDIKILMNLCERAGKEVVMNAVVTGAIKSCRVY